MNSGQLNQFCLEIFNLKVKIYFPLSNDGDKVQFSALFLSDLLVIAII